MKSMEINLEQQDQMVAVLLKSAAFGGSSEPVEHLQTHISHVILAGEFAYKIKKPLDLGFLDFSTLERRRMCCDEELRLNRRLAPDIYLDVVRITGRLENPSLEGDGDVIDYAVRMRRFPQTGLLSESPPKREEMLQLARQVAEFHQSIPAADDSAIYGTAERVVYPMLENFRQIREIGVSAEVGARLDALEAWTNDQAAGLHGLLERRKHESHIRECHGDMHLGNITRYRGRLQVFDGIEFNPNLSWIDTCNDIAFLLMDLEYRELPPRASVFLNEYLATTGDYAGLRLLRFYQLYRAMVRAKVAAIMRSQAGQSEQERERVGGDFHGYLTLAEHLARQPSPVLCITYGVSGSGKSLFSGWLAENLPAIRLRSDVERKRLFANAAPDQGLGQGLYSAAATRRTYAHLRETAETVLQAGHSVIVDATFLKADQRQSFAALAAEQDLPYLILDCTAPQAVLHERILARQAEGADPSDADLDVLALQMENREPLNNREEATSIVVDSTDYPPQGLLQRVSDHCRVRRDS